MSNHSILAIVTVEFMQTELSDQHLEYAVQEDRKYRGRRGGGGGGRGETEQRDWGVKSWVKLWRRAGARELSDQHLEYAVQEDRKRRSTISYVQHGPCINAQDLYVHVWCSLGECVCVCVQDWKKHTWRPKLAHLSSSFQCTEPPPAQLHAIRLWIKVKFHDFKPEAEASIQKVGELGWNFTVSNQKRKRAYKRLGN